METKELISKLSSDSKVIKPRSSWSGVLVYCVVFLVSLSLGVFGTGIRDDLSDKIFDPMYTGLIFSSIFGGLCAGILVLLLSIPGQRSPIVRKLVFVFSALWLFFLLFSFYQQYTKGVFIAEGMPDKEMKCSELLLLLSMLPGAVLMFLVNKNAPTKYFLCGTLIFTSAAFGSFGAVGVHCANDTGYHLLVYHVLPVMFLGVVGLMLGRLILSWDRKVEKLKRQVNS